MLKVSGLNVFYGSFQALWDLSLNVEEHEIVCLLGLNGSGKSTLLNSISGLVRARHGSIQFCGEEIRNLPTHKIVERGLSHVIERRRLFPTMSVAENLELGAHNKGARKHVKETMERVIHLFPILQERMKQRASSLSGGEQQMLAIARGLMAKPKFLMVDEPFLGLSPLVRDEIIKVFRAVNEEGVTVLFSEQNVEQAINFSNRGYVLESGRVAVEGEAKSLLQNQLVKTVYLGEN